MVETRSDTLRASTFPHGTCPLSASRQYLALDGVYHPLWAAFPNNPTPETLAVAQTGTRIGLTPALGEASIRRTSAPAVATGGVPHTTVPVGMTHEGFGAGLFPLHSPLLGKSWLVSLPPLSDMLKFSGYSRPI